MRLTLNELIYAMKGKTNGMQESQIVTAVSTDTRNITSGSLFVALKGEFFDGHDYCQQALDAGACAVVVEHAENLPEDKVILVENTRSALLVIAGVHRDKQKGKVIAVTGSVGKTTTKEMIYTILSTQGKTLKTEKNLNNEVGLSKMLLQMNEEHQYAVLEIGVDGPGQMLPMAKAVHPDIGVITNIGVSHIENFGTREKIQKEKLDLAKEIRSQGCLFLNADDPWLAGQVVGMRTAYFGVHALSAEVQGKNVIFNTNYTEFDIFYHNTSYPVRLPVPGTHNVSNALAAFSVAMELEIDPVVASKALEHYKVVGMRQNVVEHNGFTVVEDCYNASPQSMLATIQTLGALKAEGRRIAVFSDMLELGSIAEESHREVGREIAFNRIDALYCTGPLSRLIHEEAEKGGLTDSHYYATKDELADHLLQEIREGDILWFKASRGMKLEDVIKRLYEER